MYSIIDSPAVATIVRKKTAIIAETARSKIGAEKLIVSRVVIEGSNP